MTAYVGSGIALTGESTFSVAVPRQSKGKSAISNDLSGIVVEQGAPVEEAADHILVTNEWIFQTFRLPKDFPRGTVEGEMNIPALTGLQVNVGIREDFFDVASLDWRFDYFHPSKGWIGLVEGTQVGGAVGGDMLWFNINFPPVDISAFWENKFRFGIRGRDSSVVERKDERIDYDGTTFTLDDHIYTIVPDISPTPFLQGREYPFVTVDGVPSVLVLRGGNLYYSMQMGVEHIWFSHPNPFAASDHKAYHKDGVNPVQKTAAEISLRFRILAAAPGSEIDFFGNDYRNGISDNGPENLNQGFWLSKPNPSKYAVEALYFDLSQGGEAVVIDHMLIDPLIPGLLMNVYYSNDPSPGHDTETWDNLMWTRVEREAYRLRKRETFAFPAPLTAKYVKLEFTALQPRHYAPGVLQLPLVYTKHPKWVLDYFLAVYQQRRLQQHEFARRVSVSYDALDLAYNYYLDDLRLDNPDTPTSIKGSQDESLVRGFLAREQIQQINEVDAETLLRIKTSLKPYIATPFSQGRYRDILADYARPAGELFTNYSTENPVQPVASTNEVSAIDREILVIERGFPAMSFYLPCRHQYKKTLGKFEQDRAYFAGLKSISFTREHYATAYDHKQYNELAGDNINMERNDFVTVEQSWRTSSALS